MLWDEALSSQLCSHAVCLGQQCITPLTWVTRWITPLTWVSRCIATGYLGQQKFYPWRPFNTKPQLQWIDSGANTSCSTGCTGQNLMEVCCFPFWQLLCSREIHREARKTLRRSIKLQQPGATTISAEAEQNSVWVLLSKALCPSPPCRASSGNHSLGERGPLRRPCLRLQQGPGVWPRIQRVSQPALPGHQVNRKQPPVGS